MKDIQSLEGLVMHLTDRVKRLNSADWVAIYYSNGKWAARAMISRSYGESYADPFYALSMLEREIRKLEDMKTLEAAE